MLIFSLFLPICPASRILGNNKSQPRPKTAFFYQHGSQEKTKPTKHSPRENVKLTITRH